MEKINIAIADDNERMQEMLGNVIKQDDTLELIGRVCRSFCPSVMETPSRK